MSNLAYVDGGSQASTSARNAACDGEAAIEVKGSYSTKARQKHCPSLFRNTQDAVTNWFVHTAHTKHRADRGLVLLASGS